VEHFLENTGLKSEHDSRISAVHARYDPLPLQSDTLRALSDETSPDFAAVYFVRRILSMPHHWNLQKRFVAHVEVFRKDREEGRVQIAARGLENYIAVFVPGLFYESKPETKGDMAKPRALLNNAGLETQLVRIREAGTVEENGERIAAELRTRRETPTADGRGSNIGSGTVPGGTSEGVVSGSGRRINGTITGSTYSGAFEAVRET